MEDSPNRAIANASNNQKAKVNKKKNVLVKKKVKVSIMRTQNTPASAEQLTGSKRID
jgi:hypothetical protein